jgi:hypothetical protein
MEPRSVHQCTGAPVHKTRLKTKSPNTCHHDQNFELFPQKFHTLPDIDIVYVPDLGQGKEYVF